MTDRPAKRWEERHSRGFLDYARYFVPERRRQMDIILGLVPEPPHGALLVEIGSGEGLLSLALLERFPACRVLALDGSAEMRAETLAACRDHADRLVVADFDLFARDWRVFSDAPHAIVSSLVIHHLSGEEKRQLFNDMADALAPGGAFVIADMLRPASAASLAIAAAGWDEAVRANALALDGDLQAFEEFERLDWNYFRNPERHRRDRPSSLADQLLWLAEAGLGEVDCAWLFAGHAVFGGRKP